MAPNRELQREEHAAWTELCRLLKEAGAVTAEDLNSPVRGHGQTIGQQILRQVRHWGSCNVHIHGGTIGGN